MGHSVTVEAFNKKVRTTSSRRFVAVGLLEDGSLKIVGRGDTAPAAQAAAKRNAPALVWERVHIRKPRRQVRRLGRGESVGSRPVRLTPGRGEALYAGCRERST